MDSKLIEKACLDVIINKEFIPRDGETFCNMAVAHIANMIGYNGFNGRLANDIVKKMEKSDDWLNVDIEDAQSHANRGFFCVAGVLGKAHGHVATVMPNKNMEKSKVWNCDVPIIANVGERNGIMKLSEAFRKDSGVKIYALIKGDYIKA